MQALLVLQGHEAEQAVGAVREDVAAPGVGSTLGRC